MKMTSNKSYSLLILVALVAFSCNEPKPRKPLSVKTGVFLKESAERTKEILANEEKAIKSIIESDSLNSYLSSPNGYWYYYNVRDTTQNYNLKESDLVLMSYNIRTIYNDTIYSFDEIGERQFKIDREDYFPGMRTGIKLLKKGESATFYFPSPIAYGLYGDKERIGANQPIVSTIKLIDILKKSKDTIIN